MAKSNFEFFRKYLLTFFNKKIRLLFLEGNIKNSMILNSESLLWNMDVVQNKSHEIFIKRICPVLDFDGLEKKEIASKVYNEIAMLDIPSALIFSGGGFHVYHLSQAFVICPESDSCYNSNWIRLPYSWNMKEKNYAEILELTGIPKRNDKENSDLVFRLLQKVIIDRDPPHYARLFLVIFLSLRGYSNNSIFNYIRSLNWIDFDERKTEYQINYITNWGFKFLPSVKFLKRYGLVEYLEECL